MRKSGNANSIHAIDSGTNFGGGDVGFLHGYRKRKRHEKWMANKKEVYETKNNMKILRL